MFHRFLIWRLIAGLHPFEVLKSISLLSLLLLDRLKDFLIIKYVNCNKVCEFILICRYALR